MADTTSKMGRPTEYTKQVADAICARLAEGESLLSITKDAKMPSKSTIYRWLLDENKKEFWDNYAKARNIQAEVMFEELLDIADDSSNDEIEHERGDGSTYTTANTEYIQRSRLRVDTRKWYLSKVLPKKFGDKLDMTSDGQPIMFVPAEIARKNSIPLDESHTDTSAE